MGEWLGLWGGHGVCVCVCVCVALVTCLNPSDTMTLVTLQTHKAQSSERAKSGLRLPVWECTADVVISAGSHRLGQVIYELVTHHTYSINQSINDGIHSSLSTVYHRTMNRTNSHYHVQLHSPLSKLQSIWAESANYCVSVVNLAGIVYPHQFQVQIADYRMLTTERQQQHACAAVRTVFTWAID